VATWQLGKAAAMAHPEQDAPSIPRYKTHAGGGSSAGCACYPVLWRCGDAAPVAGRLEFGARTLALHGRHRGSGRRTEIPYSDVAVARPAPERIGPLRTIEIDRRRARAVLVAALAATLYHEILEKILQRSAAAFG
jgi:hypothetical protein